MTTQQTLYLVDRVSDWKRILPPCAGAYKTNVNPATDEKWVVRVESVQDFVKQNGRCVISWEDMYSMFMIIIYDDYIE